MSTENPFVKDPNLLDMLPALIWILDKEDNIIFNNKFFSTFWSNPLGITSSPKFSELAKNDEIDSFIKAKNKVLNTNNQERIEISVETFCGEKRWLDVFITPYESEEKHNCVAFTAYDITDKKKVEMELKYLSMHDHLTNIYNRSFFEEEIKRLDSNRYAPISVVVCDIDGLKLVNDSLGHAKGDELIRESAKIIASYFRKSDVVARIGGDEFAIILPKTNLETAAQICRRIKIGINKHNSSKPNPHLSISIGFATGNVKKDSVKEILKKADVNMYKEKFNKWDLVKKNITDSLRR